MSRMAGYWNLADRPEGLLRDMHALADFESMREQSWQQAGFGVVCVDPVPSPECERIAHSDDGQITVAMTGHLFSDRRSVHERPAQHVLGLYEAHGEQVGEHLNGTFTVAVHDGRDDTLRLITDRFNSRAFFYCQVGSGVLFGNSVRSILAHPAAGTETDIDAIYEFLTIGQLLGQRTYYPDIHHLPPASVLTFGNETGEKQYWTPRFDADPEEPLEDCAARLADVIRQAVREGTIEGGRDGLMLSGGLDSRMIAAASSGKPICLTMHTADGVEVALARRVAEALGCEHRFVRLDSDFPRGLLKAGSLAGDAMHPFSQAQPIALAETVGTLSLQRMYNGWGMDMYFAGLWMTSRRGGREPANELSGDSGDYFLGELASAPEPEIQRLLGAERAEHVREQVRTRLRERFDECRALDDNVQNAIALAIVRNFSRFPHYLNLKALSAITREVAPMHDVRLIDAFLRMPVGHRFGARAYRRALRLLNEEMTRIPYSGTGVPLYENAFTERVASYLHRKVVRRVGKVWHFMKGTSERMVRGPWPNTPVAIRHERSWPKLLRDTAAESYLVDRGIVDGQGLVKLVEGQIDGRHDAFELMANWLTLEQWFRCYR